MAGTQLDYIVQQFSININGYGHAGDGEMCSLPKIKKKMEEFQGGGMLFPRKRAVGYQALDFSCDLSSFDPTVLGTCGLYGANQNLVFSVAGFISRSVRIASRIAGSFAFSSVMNCASNGPMRPISILSR